MDNKKTYLLIGRVLLFCILCALLLVISSAATNSLPRSYANILSIGLALIGAFLATVVFTKWEDMSLNDIGVLPGNKTIPRILTGFCIGAALASLQPLLVLTFGHVTIARSPETGFIAMTTNLILFLLVACREEIAFRGYPMSNLRSSIGAVGAQVIIVIIFIIEHKISGMTWVQAIIGPGMGAILFGLAVVKTKGLALSTGLHTAWNFTQWFLGFKTGFKGVYHISIQKGFEVNTEWIGWASYIFVMGLGICIVQLGWRNERTQV